MHRRTNPYSTLPVVCHESNNNNNNAFSWLEMLITFPVIRRGEIFLLDLWLKQLIKTSSGETVVASLGCHAVDGMCNDVTSSGDLEESVIFKEIQRSKLKVDKNWRSPFAF